MRRRGVNFSSGYNSADGGYVGAGWRGAFHDLNASHLGYPRYAEIEVMSGDLRYYPRLQEVGVERLRILNILSLTPFDRVFRKVSGP